MDLKIISSVLGVLIILSLAAFTLFGIIISDGDVSRKVILRCRVYGTIAAAGYGLFLVLAVALMLPVNGASVILAGVIMVSIVWSMRVIISQPRPAK